MTGTIDRLNDFVGFRPVAVLENGRQMQVYPHEKFRPLPVYFRDSGVACGVYQKLIEQTIKTLQTTPDDLLHQAHFRLERMDEIAIDLRAHDHLHPVNKRTNYMFGEWDPHIIDNQGYYRRFVIRRLILDSLLAWIDEHKEIPLQERLEDAAAVLSGTMLMASSISGSGPDTHASDISLTSLLPKVARQRDDYYNRLLASARATAERSQTVAAALRTHSSLSESASGTLWRPAGPASTVVPHLCADGIFCCRPLRSRRHPLHFGPV